MRRGGLASEWVTDHKMSVIDGIRAHVSLPLYRNAYSLILSSTLSSGLGLVYWVLTARLYPAAAVGINSALLSAMLFLSSVAQLNLGEAFVRYIPQAGRANHRFASRAYLTSCVATAIACLAFLNGLVFWFPSLRFLREDHQLGLWFILATVIWSIFSLQDDLLTGLRATSWVPLGSTIFARAKIVLLLPFAGLAHQYGIFASWTIPMAVACLPINLAIFRYLIPAHAQAAGQLTSPIVPSQIVRYVASNYLGTLFSLVATSFLPLIVTQRLGATANAYFYQPWMIVYALQYIGRSVAIHPDERLLQELRERQKTPAGRARLRQRVAVEHTLAHVGHWQGRRARYCGTRKNLFDLRRTAVVQNLHVLMAGQHAAPAPSTITGPAL